MYKVVAIGTNKVRAFLAMEEKQMTFKTYREAEDFLIKTNEAGILPNNYSLTIEKTIKEL
ncbi:hypothetical protein QGM71_12975 [Virgibacillus sp. C22-A2]|uniref:Uncharacterized protein n=1 Tax=Virgibacillus tibetensis TaxID=3042313 RepID=A0ABU6KH60_9BACI|nr:hypothetical protein [Virgibacillus sp. C22-A2]